MLSTRPLVDTLPRLAVSLLLLSGLVRADNHGADPLSVVNARMAAYNAHDIEAFLSTYAEDIQVYTYPNIPLGKPGKVHLRGIFEPMFAQGQVSVEIHQQITQGRYVVNHETVTYSDGPQKYVSIYAVEDGEITAVRFLRE